MPTKLVHDGNRATRMNDFISEKVFADLWQTLNISENDGGCYLLLILKDLPPPISQRDTTIAAILVQWLGTKAGGIFMENAKQMQRDGSLSLTEAYLKQWKILQERKRALDSGLTCLEYLILPAPDPEESPAARQFRLEHLFEQISSGKTIVATERDQEVARGIIRWLSSDRGQLFIETAEAQIKSFEPFCSEFFDWYWNKRISNNNG